MLRNVILLALLCVQVFPAYAADRERAVLIYPRERWSLWPVFYTRHQNDLRQQLRQRYAVEVHRQVATDDALFAVDVTGAKLLVISAHGDPFSMYFAGRTHRTLDGSDRWRLSAFLERLDPHATIVLQSCHTGRGFAHLVKQLAGPDRTVIAAKGEVPWDGVHITSVEPFDVRITCEDEGKEWDCTVKL
ncbi:MAG TPA: hypothetical protein VGF69_19465 [Thermoanaerobaculia bacterium]|jgi:hypothetical protein